MLKLIAIAAGVGLIVIEILIQKFNEGQVSRWVAWLAGVYIGLAAISVAQGDILDGVLCCLPTIAILLPDLIGRCYDVVGV